MFKFYKNHYSTAKNLKLYKDKFNTKIKGTVIEKLVNYLKLVGRDYKDVTVSVKQDIRSRPLKAAFYFSSASFLAYCAKLNPDLKSFKAKHIQFSNELNLVPPTLTNPTASNHLKYIQKCFNCNLVRHVNLGAFSIIWVDKYSHECDLYENSCSYLQVPYWGIANRILDVGFLNIWWNISRKMLDYDINY